MDFLNLKCINNESAPRRWNVLIVSNQNNTEILCHSLAGWEEYWTLVKTADSQKRKNQARVLSCRCEVPRRPFPKCQEREACQEEKQATAASASETWWLCLTRQESSWNLRRALSLECWVFSCLLNKNLRWSVCRRASDNTEQYSLKLFLQIWMGENLI